MTGSRPGQRRNATSLRVRFGAGLALGAVAGIVLLHAFVINLRREVASESAQRQAVVELQALGALVPQASDDEALRAVVAAWQRATPGVAKVRVTRGMQLLASTAAADGAPRRLQREEKPLYDRAQRLGSAVQANRDEPGSRKPEIEAATLEDRRLSLAAPLAGGLLELETAPLPAAPATGWILFLVALLAPLIVYGAATLWAGERRVPLALVAVACLAASLGALWRSSARLVEHDLRAGATEMAARAKEQGALVQSVSGASVNLSELDVDTVRQPRGALAANGDLDPVALGAVVALELRDLGRASLAALILATALLLASGLGGFSAVATALRRNRQAYLYIAPAIVGMLLLVFYPVCYGITLSFTDSNLYNTNQSIPQIWVGLRNYAEILGSFSFIRESGINYANFYWTLLFTVGWTVSNVTIGVTSGLFLALILNTRALAFRPVYRILLILPWAMPNYITALIWKGMFHQQFGVVNQVLQIFGLPAVSWFDHPFTSFLTALATNSWLSFPFMMVVSLGALQSIPTDLYEAARVDGASRWQQFKAITLPSLRPALVPAVILSVVWTFNMFNIIYLVTAGDPGGSTEILVTQAYKYAFERYRYGYAAAYSTVIFGILLVYGSIQNRLSKATEN